MTPLDRTGQDEKSRPVHVSGSHYDREEKKLVHLVELDVLYGSIHTDFAVHSDPNGDFFHILSGRSHEGNRMENFKIKFIFIVSSMQ